MKESTSETPIVIQKSQATFRMDGDGKWCNQHGVFRHKRIIDLFNAAIQKDGGGYFVTQNRGEVYEKVYFPYEETALFVVEVIWGVPNQIRLNTGRLLEMKPGQLFVSRDHLFYGIGDEIAKFNQNALMAVSGALSFNNGHYCFMDGDTPIELREAT